MTNRDIYKRMMLTVNFNEIFIFLIIILVGYIYKKFWIKLILVQEQKPIEMLYSFLTKLYKLVQLFILLILYLYVICNKNIVIYIKNL